MQTVAYIVNVVERSIGKPGSLYFRMAHDTLGVMAIRALSISLDFAVSVVLAWLLEKPLRKGY